jgi:Na+/H+ antiporter NhaA
MDIFLRTVAIFIEVLLLAGIMFSMLLGVKLILVDLGLGPKYKKMITIALLAGGVISLVFFISHLTTFYPTV